MEKQKTTKTNTRNITDETHTKLMWLPDLLWPQINKTIISEETKFVTCTHDTPGQFQYK